GADDPEAGDHALVADLAGRLAPEDVQLYYQVALLGRRDLELAPDPRRGCEMTLLRMHAFSPDGAGSATAGQAAPGNARAGGDAPRRGTPRARARTATPDRTEVREGGDAPPAGDLQGGGDWHARVAVLRLGGMARQLANHCTLVREDERAVVLRLDPSGEQLRTPRGEQALERALREALGRDVKLTIEVGEVEAETPAARATRENEERQRAAEQSIASDPHVQALREAFGAEVEPGSVRPR
ncbi:MAG: DNA polymerase III subunit gamma/tau C-terminal domain-containing protein, partial [Gammaproteobacteria bacterium]|nr:DNA polymerase III subunit gamma/tau C-terminal domain-containing protein [Gammaproteobacteria bacterium]